MATSKTVLFSLCIALALPSYAQEDHIDQLSELSIEDLLSVQVTSVTKASQSLRDSAAAIHVITNQDIRKHGYVSIPEALRSVPGLHVAEITPHQSAISSRGFQNLWSNKLLVMMDGRTIYTPFYGGVYWDMQDTVMQDIERIEVIRGPGGSLWGANAVNGVVNIITKHNRDAQGSVASARVGGQATYASARHTMALGEHSSLRLYAKHKSIDDGTDLFGADARDGTEFTLAGARFDADLGPRNTLTMSLGATSGENRRYSNLSTLVPLTFTQLATEDDISAQYINAKWQRELVRGGSVEVRAFYDHYDRDVTTLEEHSATTDVEFQHLMPLTGALDLTWGIGYRSIESEVDSTFNVSLAPESRDDQVSNAFVQMQWTSPAERLRLTLGSKFEDNDYTGFETQPTLRALWHVADDTQIWAAGSQAKRTPSRFESDATLRFVTPGFPTPTQFSFAGGGDDLNAEEVTTLEAGLRHTFSESGVQLDVALFHSDYDDLVDLAIGPPLCLPSATFPPCFNPTDIVLSLSSQFASVSEAKVRGGEVTVDWMLPKSWHLRGHYSYLDADADNATLSIQAPEQQFGLELSGAIGERSELTLAARYIDAIDNLDVDAYTAFDLRWAWQLNAKTELSLIGRNLFEDGRIEYYDASVDGIPSEVEEQIFVEVRVAL